jgi:hypothetical protein
MTVDKHAKVVRLSGKHAPHQLSLIDFHVLQSKFFLEAVSKRYVAGLYDAGDAAITDPG